MTYELVSNQSYIHSVQRYIVSEIPVAIKKGLILHHMQYKKRSATSHLSLFGWTAHSENGCTELRN